MADTPQQPQPEQRQEIRPRKSTGRTLRDHPIRVVVFLIVLVGAAIGGYTLWNYLESYESTDDTPAEIDGDIYAVTSRIAGTVKAVYVEEQIRKVKAGQLLIELDPLGLRSIAGAGQRRPL